MSAEVLDHDVDHVLQIAMELIDTPDKWCQGHMRERDDSGATCKRCAIGALDDAAHGLYTVEFAVDVARATRDRMYDVMQQRNIRCSIPKWNDAPKRTHADVLKVFAQALERTK